MTIAATTDFATNEQIILAARRRLPQARWDYLVGGSESETTMRRNRDAFDRWALRPRTLVDVSSIDTSTTFMGQKLRMPVVLAPVGGLGTFWPDGNVAVAQAASEFGTMHVIASGANPDMERIAGTGDFPKVFQLYVQGDEDWVRDIVTRVKPSGYIGLCVTADVAIYSRRERAMLSDAIPAAMRDPTRRNYLAELTWEYFDRIREMTGGLPMMLKGVATAEDAEMACERGVEVIWVSNHGGRQLDHGIGSLGALPEIVDAVRGRAQIVLDGGVQRATDVLKAIALGADVVALGKMQGWGLAANGAEGVARMLEIMELEMVSAMGLLGVTRIDQLSPAYLRRAEPVTPAHEMSAWVKIGGGRVL
jgi:glycolate oxidase